jgi:hypothetical protein
VLLRGALAGELTHHLGYANGAAPEEVESHRNGYSEETVVGEEGAVKIEVPRDRSGSFEPLLIAKGEKRFEGVDEKIIAMDARGMTVREIQGFLCGWKERQALARELRPFTGPKPPRWPSSGLRGHSAPSLRRSSESAAQARWVPQWSCAILWPIVACSASSIRATGTPDSMARINVVIVRGDNHNVARFADVDSRPQLDRRPESRSKDQNYRRHILNPSEISDQTLLKLAGYVAILVDRAARSFWVRAEESIASARFRHVRCSTGSRPGYFFL